jgi:hypothetical protein
VAYRGWVQLSVEHIAEAHTLQEVKRQASLLPQTVAAFCGADGHSVHIWVRFALPDGSLPQDLREAERFHREAYRVAVTAYQPLFAPAIAVAEPSLLQFARETLDASPYYNMQAAAFVMPQPEAFEADAPKALSNRHAPSLAKGSKAHPVTDISRLEEFLGRRYEFRYNEMTDTTEYRPRLSFQYQFMPLDERAQNSVCVEALREGLSVWDRDLSRILHSDFVRPYNPVEDYLNSVGEWDGVDRIDALARRVPTSNPHWPALFRTFLLGMVAHWRGIDREHGHCTTPVLSGPQGYRKSTFCLQLLPPELRFAYTDSLDFGQKAEAMRYLCRFALICLDEFDQISDGHQAFLKHLLQKPRVVQRKVGGSVYQEMRRYASFIATTNRTDILKDPTGSRRFLCVLLTGPIDVSTPIDHRQLYAQLMTLLRRGERYWMDSEEEALMQQYNEEFMQQSPLEQVFRTYVLPAAEHEEGEWKTCTEIFHYLQRKSRDKFSNSQLSPLGRIANKYCTVTKKSGRGMLYWVKMG